MLNELTSEVAITGGETRHQSSAARNSTANSNHPLEGDCYLIFNCLQDLYLNDELDHNRDDPPE